MTNNNKLVLGRCVYDPETRTISSDNRAPQVIGHVQAKLLKILYSEPKNYFSNEDLQREVWDNRFIENTTIRTTVSYLRKALGESVDCRYIESARNKGYRFVANIEEISNRRRLRKFFPSTIIAGLISLLIYVIFLSNAPLIVPQIQTTLLGQESDGTVSGELLVFSHKPLDSKFWNLYAKKLGQERYFRLTSGEYSDSNAVFSKDGKKLAFHRYDGMTCKIIVADLDRKTNKLNNLDLVFNCIDELSSVAIAWKDKNTLYLSYTNSMHKPYQVYSFNIKTGQSTPITFPPGGNSGDYYVTNSYESNKMAFLRNMVGSRTEVWIYDERKNKSSKIATVPVILMTAAWIDSGKKLVIQTKEGELSALDIKSGKLELLFKAPYQISFPYSVDKQTIGYMRGFLHVRDVIRLDLNGNIENVITSAFNDSRPAYAQNAGDIAFISNRSGISQIWLLKKDGELQQLTQFDANTRITGLTISHDGKSVAFTINAVLYIFRNDDRQIIYSANDRIYSNPIFSGDGKRIYYGVKDSDKWYIEYRSMKQLSTKETLVEGHIVIPCTTSDCFYFMRFNEKTLYKSTKGITESLGIELSNIQSSDQLSVIDDNDAIYYVSRFDDKTEVKYQNLKTKKAISLVRLPASRFSIEQKPLRFLTSISRKSETHLEMIKINN